MKKIILIFSFLFILIGCGGGGGSSKKLVDINQANLNDILATYYSSLDFSEEITYYFRIPPNDFNANDGEYKCNMGGTYNITTKDNQKIFKYNNCKILNNQTRVEVTFKGTVKISNNGFHREFTDFSFDRYEYIKFSGSLDYSSGNGLGYYKLNIKNLYSKDKVEVKLKGGVYERSEDYNKHITIKSINTTATSSKLDGNIKIQTISKIKRNQKCPTSGEIKISGSKDYLDIKYRSTMNIDVYLNNSNSVITSFNDCGDFPYY